MVKGRIQRYKSNILFAEQYIHEIRNFYAVFFSRKYLKTRFLERTKLSQQPLLIMKSSECFILFAIMTLQTFLEFFVSFSLLGEISGYLYDVWSRLIKAI